MRILSEKSGFYIVQGEVLPEVFRHVVEAKRLLKTGAAATVHEAVKQAGISRSAFYKYKDAVFSFSEGTHRKIITLSLELKDEPGVLSGILNAIAAYQGNILTIHQNIPIHGIANSTISVDTREMLESQEVLLESLAGQNGVLHIEVLAQG